MNSKGRVCVFRTVPWLFRRRDALPAAADTMGRVRWGAKGECMFCYPINKKIPKLLVLSLLPPPFRLRLWLQLLRR